MDTLVIVAIVAVAALYLARRLKREHASPGCAREDEQSAVSGEERGPACHSCGVANCAERREPESDDD